MLYGSDLLFPPAISIAIVVALSLPAIDEVAKLSGTAAFVAHIHHNLGSECVWTETIANSNARPCCERHGRHGLRVGHLNGKSTHVDCHAVSPERGMQAKGSPLAPLQTELFSHTAMLLIDSDLPLELEHSVAHAWLRGG